jgi:hypothetical protein
MALSNGQKITECFVDEHGRFTRQMGHQLEGKEVLGEGSNIVLDMFEKHVLHTSEHIHSYPHDWRTKLVSRNPKVPLYAYFLASNHQEFFTMVYVSYSMVSVLLLQYSCFI